MLWRVRTTFTDRPGILAEIALACGSAEVNILGMQVFATGERVTDVFVVSAPEGWTDLQIANLFEDSGGAQVSVTRPGHAIAVLVHIEVGGGHRARVLGRAAEREGQG